MRGKTGEQLRIAVSRLIECISLANLPLSPSQHQQYISLIDESLKNPLEEIQVSSVKALTQLSKTYQTQGEYLQHGSQLVSKIIATLKEKSVVNIIAGYTASLGTFSH